MPYLGFAALSAALVAETETSLVRTGLALLVSALAFAAYTDPGDWATWVEIVAGGVGGALYALLLLDPQQRSLFWGPSLSEQFRRTFDGGLTLRLAISTLYLIIFVWVYPYAAATPELSYICLGQLGVILAAAVGSVACALETVLDRPDRAVGSSALRPRYAFLVAWFCALCFFDLLISVDWAQSADLWIAWTFFVASPICVALPLLFPKAGEESGIRWELSIVSWLMRAVRRRPRQRRT